MDALGLLFLSGVHRSVLGTVLLCLAPDCLQYKQVEELGLLVDKDDQVGGQCGWGWGEGSGDVELSDAVGSDLLRTPSSCRCPPARLPACLQGVLLQIFTKPLGDRPTVFFEIIQRLCALPPPSEVGDQHLGDHAGGRVTSSPAGFGNPIAG